MPYGYVYQCPECAFDVEVIIAREFCYNAAGERVEFDYPDKDRQEWPVRRVSGLWSRLWCPGCRAIRPYVLLELETPAATPAHVFFAAEERRLTGAETGPCPECSTTLRLEVEEETCPHCGRGQLALVGEYEP